MGTCSKCNKIITSGGYAYPETSLFPIDSSDIAYDGVTLSELGISKYDTISVALQKINIKCRLFITSSNANEPIGSNKIFNIVSLTQAEYDAGTPIETTMYIITS